MGEYKKYAEDDSYVLYQGTMQDVIDNELKENSIDCILTDPPYELNFMNKGWDNSGVAFQKETWERCLKVLKPGGYLLAFGGTRTYHRITCAIEDAGFEIRDCIMYLYGTGFPKNMNIGLAIDKKNGVDSPVVGQNEQILKKQAKDLKNGKRKIADSYNNGAPDRNNGFKNVSADIKEAQNKWKGWGTALKPAYEPIVVARKPFKNSLIDNVLEYEVGGLNIDECRIAFNGDKWKAQKSGFNSRAYQSEKTTTANSVCEANENGRYPANVIHDGSEEATKDMPNTKGSDTEELGKFGFTFGKERDSKPMAHGYNDEGSASRYFYCAKASKKDRDEGLDDFESKKTSMLASNDNIDKDGNFTGMLAGRETEYKNIHPTVKNVELMQYLVRLVAPKNAIILDCFMGSGSTGKAVMFENRERNMHYKFIGIEMTEEYLPICEARIKWAKYRFEYDLEKPIQEKVVEGQKSLF